MHRLNGKEFVLNADQIKFIESTPDTVVTLFGNDEKFMVKEGVDYTGLANRVHRPDIYREVAKEMSLDVPQEDMRTETLFDGITFDPAQHEEYARGFAVHNIV